MEKRKKEILEMLIDEHKRAIIFLEKKLKNLEVK